MLNFNRCLHDTATRYARTRFTIPKPKPIPSSNPRKPTQTTHYLKNLEVTPPIPPSTANKQFHISDTHPLWQFFHTNIKDNKKSHDYITPPSQLDTQSRSWSITELRRKSFNDLHSLWYACLRQRNIFAREMHLINTETSSNKNNHVHSLQQINEKCRVTMWRIRHVLSERDYAFRIARSTTTNNVIDQLSEQVETTEQLERFQYAVFGISEIISENVIDRKFIDGLKYITNLKLKILAKKHDTLNEKLVNDLQLNYRDNTSSMGINDLAEAFIVFIAEFDLESSIEACDAIKELRSDPKNKISKYDELETISKYIKQLKESSSSQDEVEVTPEAI
ncbi:mitochondrial 54S ribosomal protein uL29m NDAI_0J02720 [Naumovozyma dairenensis CBS 421]|uniref:Large ribosomal subunit protein uL29m n=1 Tax=Naumovozyma dairenensis (strain ATCC 10597 / BCRC 20456 / CBS 421 / NBRC 0211 / NRRL Y-12639) TaxID=1071378 RepID=G0WH86_NAUDC|nr:hypothetical protein NDAI_0J02720 [Naumovozyma dairenensis CBS 421]CCD27164.1 hypothetical protein NDAI_0J02720 [Naumovozyma dairenensis CBS 421]